MADPDFEAKTRTLHARISACLTAEDLKRVAEYLKEFYAEAKAAGTLPPKKAYEITQVEGPAGGRAWVAS